MASNELAFWLAVRFIGASRDSSSDGCEYTLWEWSVWAIRSVIRFVFGVLSLLLWSEMGDSSKWPKGCFFDWIY